MSSKETNQTLEQIYAEQQEFTTLEIGQYEAVKILLTKWLTQKRKSLFDKDSTKYYRLGQVTPYTGIDELLEELK
jgi:hypothetical protein